MAFQKTKWATAAIAALAIGSGSPIAAFAATSPEDCIEQGNVWVHVEYDETVTGGCATEFANALEATSSAGLADGTAEYVTTIDGRLADEGKREFWSLWEHEDDGSWTMSQLGAPEMPVEAGDIVGWALQPDWNVNPGPAPSADPMQTAVEPAAEASDEAAEETGSNMTMWIIVGVVALALIAFGIYAALRKKPQADR